MVQPIFFLSIFHSPTRSYLLTLSSVKLEVSGFWALSSGGEGSGAGFGGDAASDNWEGLGSNGAGAGALNIGGCVSTSLKESFKSEIVRFSAADCRQQKSIKIRSVRIKSHTHSLTFLWTFVC